MSIDMIKNWKPSLFTALALSSAVVITGPAHSDVSSLAQNIQGAESDVRGSINDVNARAMSVFKDQKIKQVASSLGKSGETQTLTGKKGDMTIDIQLDARGSNQTHIGIIAKQGSLKWNKDFANLILDKIVARG
jgi:hypothetical protein